MDLDLIKKLYLEDNLDRTDVANYIGISKGKLIYLLRANNINKLQSKNYDELGLKSCSKCKIQKPLTFFYKRSDTQYTSWCRECNNKQTVNRQQKIKIEAVNYKGGCCQNCEFKEYMGALDFHHLDPDKKDFDFASYGSRNSINDALSELDKCVLLCANCHRMTHAGLTKFSSKIFEPYIEQVKILKEVKDAKICKICFVKVSSSSTYCKSCRPRKTKIEWPSNEDLTKLVWNTPRTTLAKTMGVSDRAIAKRCTKLGIAQPPSGYWAKLAAGKIK